MDFGPDGRRPRGEAIIPMINIVFLLLIFFLITATLTPPEVSDIAPPVSASGEEREVTQPLLVDADGAIRWGRAEGDAAFAGIAAAWAGAAERGESPTLVIRADANAPGAAIAAILTRLAEAGVTSSALVTGGAG